MTQHAFCKDDSGHWYLIPYTDQKRFHNLLSGMAEADEFVAINSENEFIDLFDKFRVRGDPSLVPVYVDSPEAIRQQALADALAAVKEADMSRDFHGHIYGGYFAYGIDAATTAIRRLMEKP